MKVLDRYITRELVVPILYSSLSLIVLILVADLFDNLTEFIRYKTPFNVIDNYYLSLIPMAFVQTIPWAAWLGTLFLLINFGLHNELIAMKVAGLKIISIIRPVLFLGFLAGILTFLVSDRILPITHRVTKELSDVYIEKSAHRREETSIRNVTFHSGGNHLYYFRTLSLKSDEAEDVIILWLDRTSHKTFQKISARKAIWKENVWE